MVVQLLNPSNQLIEKLFEVTEEAGDNYLVQQLDFQHGTSLGILQVLLLLEIRLTKLKRHKKPSTIIIIIIYIFHGIGPLADPFRSHVSRSLFKGLP